VRRPSDRSTERWPDIVRCALLVLNYNGRRHLDDCLSSALVAARRSRHDCAVVLVDNRSTEDDVAYVRAAYPEVEIVVAARNDYLFSLNAVAAERSEDVVIILNNDMRFDPGFIDPLIEHFRDPAVFAAAARMLEWDGSAEQCGVRYGELRRGWFHSWFEGGRESAALTLQAAGGAAAFRRWMFVALGGFDALYRPGYFEDFDLSIQAWRRGWRCVFEPASRIFHRESVTMTEVFGTAGTTVMHARNRLLFTVANIGGWRFLALFLALLPVRAARAALRGEPLLARAARAMLPRLPGALRRRVQRDREAVRSLGSVLAEAGRPVELPARSGWTDAQHAPLAG
jgi:GT2 family glycosyltransferase